MMDRDKFLKLKIGDEFVVSKDAEYQSLIDNEEGYHPGWAPRMNRLIGETLIVDEKADIAEYIRTVDDTATMWTFHRLMIEPAEHKAKIDISLESVFA